jgi:hypothetical protein
MLDGIPNDNLASLNNYTLDEIISILQSYSCDPIVNSNQAGFEYFLLLIMLYKKSLTCISRSPWSHLSLGMYGNQGFMSL